jgi:hypothetical protein
MARQINFTYNGAGLNAVLKKVDRKKIYGWSNTEIKDDQGALCSLASIVDGNLILPSGATSLVALDEKGEMIDKSTLVGVNQEGQKVEKVPSVYDQEVVLREATMEEYFNLGVKAVYQLESELIDGTISEALKGGKILYFVYNYRADYEGDDAFLIYAEDTFFAITGKCAEFEFIGLEDNETELVAEESTEEEGEDLDFAMF